jgi:hypothetical protein
MAKISQFNRQSCISLRAEMDAAFESINKKFGIKLSAGNISFTNTTATIKVTAATISAEGHAITAEVQAFNEYKNAYGLGSYAVGQTIQLEGKNYTIAGLKPRCKSPLIIERLGQKYRISVPTFQLYNPA